MDLLGAFQVSANIAGSLSAAASIPVEAVDLPQADVVGGVGVVQLSVGVSARLVGDDALAVVLLM